MSAFSLLKVIVSFSLFFSFRPLKAHLSLKWFYQNGKNVSSCLWIVCAKFYLVSRQYKTFFFNFLVILIEESLLKCSEESVCFLYILYKHIKHNRKSAYLYRIKVWSLNRSCLESEVLVGSAFLINFFDFEVVI